MRRLWCGLLVGVAALAAGCGGGEKAHTVSGTVTFDGEPVKEGHIAFHPAGGGAGAGASISGGRYSVTAPAGKYRVEVNASRMTKLPPGQTGMNGATEEVREFIPKRYNSASELTADVPGPDPLNFDLKTGK